MSVRFGRGVLVAGGVVLLLAGCSQPSHDGATPGTSTASAPATPGTAATGGTTPAPGASAQALLDVARERGSVRVILSLAVDYTPEAELSGPDAVRTQRARIADAQQRVLAGLDPYRADVNSRPERWPLLAVAVDEPGLRHLLGSPLVKSVQHDKPQPPTG